MPKHPTQAASADELSPEKRRLLDLLSGFEAERVFSHSKRSRVESGRVPLSYGQEWFWLLDDMSSDLATYTVPLGFELTGEVKIEALDAALVSVVQRHDALRARFRQDGPDRWAEVMPAPGSVLATTDLREKPSPSACRDARIESELQRPFSLENGPLFRFNLYQTGERDWFLLLLFHHVAVDGFSLPLLLAEVERSYRGAAGGDLPDLPVSHADYARREFAEDSRWDEALDYWEAQVAEPPAVPVFQGGDPGLPRGSGGKIFFDLGPDLSRELDRFSRQHLTTQFSVLLSAFGALLARYTGDTEVMVATAVTRRSPAVQSMVGPFANTLPLRIQGGRSLTFSSLVGETSEQLRVGLEHQDVPFVRLSQRLRQSGVSELRSLYRATLVLRTGRGTVLDLPGVQVSSAGLDTQATDMDLYMDLEERPDGLKGTLAFDRSALSLDSAKVFLDQFKRVLTHGLRQPRSLVTQIPLLEGGEEEVLLEVLSGGRPIAQEFPMLPTLLREVGSKNRDKEAMEDEGGCLTYGELLDQATRVSRGLADRGIGKGDRVGVAMPRSADQIVALCGVLLSGAAYVPLDLNYPRERLVFIAKDSELRFILSLPGEATTSDLAPDTLDWDELLNTGSDGIIVDPQVAPDDLAYVIYTSGSSGQPKGVAVPHSSMAWYVGTAAKTWMKAEDRCLQFASVCFDASVFEIFATLAAGATLVLRNESMLRSPGIFLEVCESWRITVLCVATAFWHEIGDGIRLNGLRIPAAVDRVVIGGEQASESALKAWKKAVPSVRILNGYGPTETTVWATLAEMDDVVHIGRPLPGARAYVVDQEDTPVPQGMIGELLIGGPGVAHGYLNQPALTHGRFVPNPFHAGRCYRTGDLVRFRPDGSLEFMGRRDSQIQLRGYRIELGEIEAVLEEHPQVRSALVRFWPEEKRIAAFIVARDSASRSLHSDLLEWVRDRVPDYMVPSAILALSVLPHTPSGKVDRLALPEPDWVAHAVFVAPEGRIEKSVAQVFADVLKCSVGALDDFFLMGGHSLLAISAAGHLQKRLGAPVTLRMILDSPTVRGLARKIEGHGAEGTFIEGVF